MPVMKIITNYWAKPIPDRQFDWSAMEDGATRACADGAAPNRRRSKTSSGSFKRKPSGWRSKKGCHDDQGCRRNPYGRAGADRL
jgi:hypothetical protein